MSDPRDDLAALIELTEFGYDTERRPPSAWGYSIAEAILARWRLVPVEQPVIEAKRHGHDFDPEQPPQCSAQTFPGSQVDPPSWCENDVTHWDEHHNPWCAIHSARPDDGLGE